MFKVDKKVSILCNDCGLTSNNDGVCIDCRVPHRCWEHGGALQNLIGVAWVNTWGSIEAGLKTVFLKSR